MYVPGAEQAVVKYLNRWYRRCALPRGTMDHFYRGTRMSYNRTKRIANCVMSLFMFPVCAVWFVPWITEGQTPLFALFLKVGAIGPIALGVILLLQAFCEFVVVNDDGLLKSDLFGRKTQIAWNEILHFQVKPDDNKVIFFGKDKFKLTMSLAYNGWQDFLEMAARRLNPATYTVIAYTLSNVNAKPVIVRRTPKSLWKKPAVTKR